MNLSHLQKFDEPPTVRVSAPQRDPDGHMVAVVQQVRSLRGPPGHTLHHRRAARRQILDTTYTCAPPQPSTPKDLFSWR